MNIWDQQLLDRKTYEQVFARLWQRSGSEPGLLYSYALHDELSLFWVLLQRRRVVSEIRSAVKGTKFAFSPLKKAIAMLDKEREIYVSDWPERVLLMAMADILRKETAHCLSDRVYSFIPGRGQVKALRGLSSFVEQASEPVYILKRDISSYGDSIDRQLLIELLVERTSIGKSRYFLSVLEKALAIDFVTKSDPTLQSLKIGIPSGSPLVPPLENFYLLPLDEALASYPNCFYGRYGDDFVFATTDRKIAEQVDHEIESIVRNLKLSIKPEKKKNYVLDKNTHRPDESMFDRVIRFEWLGASILSTGTTGCKRDHFLSAKAKLKNDLQAVVKNVSDPIFSEAEKKEVLSRGVEEVLKCSELSKVISSYDNNELAKSIDVLVAETITRYISRYWRVNKKKAWKLYRLAKVPSAQHIRNCLVG